MYVREESWCAAAYIVRRSVFVEYLLEANILMIYDRSCSLAFSAECAN